MSKQMKWAAAKFIVWQIASGCARAGVRVKARALAQRVQ